MNLLLDSALKATAILFAAWTATLLLRRASADVRHTIWLIAMLAVAVLPAALAIPQSAIPAAARIVVPAIVGGNAQAAMRKLPWLFMIWAAGAGLVIARLILGIVAAARITRSARALDQILYSDRATTPMTWGFLRPVVILPSYAIEWTAAERDLVVRHERAHIARRDWLWQMLANVVTAVFWFHPLMWLANIQLRREAEAAADDLVLSTGAVASDYAQRLVDVARRLNGFSAPVAMIPMVRKPELETRVRAILDPSRRRAVLGTMMRCTIMIAAAMLILPIAVTRQHVYAQGKVYQMGPGMTQPRIIHKVEPVYSEQARADRIEGAVRLQAEITTEGIAENIRVTRSLDPDLDASAIAAVSKWRFKPGTKNDEPVTVFVIIEVNFHLK